MSFAKAQTLVTLALLAASRRCGVSLADIVDEFGVSHRTAQRMTDALEATFHRVVAEDGPDRRRRWRLADPQIARLQARGDSAVEAIDIAIATARDENRLRHARALERIRADMMAPLPALDALRAEADAEAVLSAMGHVARPGPRAVAAPEVFEAVFEALRGPFRMRIRYGAGNEPERTIEPHGLLLGPRSYLVALQPGRSADFLNFRMDRIHSAVCLDESFPFRDGFSIQDYAARAFGAFHDPSQYREVVWRFEPGAAARAAGFRFHPHQQVEPQPDGSLIVRFRAAGWLEMAWFLYEWGDQVSVLEPPELRALVEPYRRSDFPALP
jgi:predicted DNA-binding transcriptional regulator YafY